ncbi:MAG: three-Cys-motif partner protein TcmP [Bacteroidota bacterium]
MRKKRATKANSSKNDGFPILKAENWYFNKLKIIQSYIKAYHKRFDLRNKTKMLVYVGSGPGVVQFNNNIEVPGTPLEILGMAETFQRYIFCEKNPDYASALKVRVGRDYPQHQSIIIEGDINETIEKLPPYLPEKINKAQTAILCIIDVQSFDVNFETIEMLSAMDVDFILVNSYLHTAYYNYNFYLEEERESMNAYFGTAWARLAESTELKSDTSFFLLVIKAYQEQIRHLGYNVTGTLHKYNLEEVLVPYYQIAFCTKSKALNSLKKTMVSEASKQTELFE